MKGGKEKEREPDNDFEEESEELFGSSFFLVVYVIKIFSFVIHIFKFVVS